MAPQQVRDTRGFTLVELLVVILLIGIITTFALPGISSVLKVSISSSTRELASTIKEAYNASVMTKRMVRLVYDIDAGTYWVESSMSGILMDTDASREKEKRRRRNGAVAEKEAAGGFQMDRNVTRKERSLPRGVSFEDVSTEQIKDPIEKGKAYTHFFPHGLIERTVIHLKDTSQHEATLVIQPMVGRTRLLTGKVPVEEAMAE